MIETILISMIQIAVWNNEITRLELWSRAILHVDIHGTSYHWVWAPLGALLGPEGHLAARVISISVTYTVSGAMVAPGPRLLLRTMSGSMALQHLGYVSMSMAHVATKSHTDAQVLGHHLWLW